MKLTMTPLLLILPLILLSPCFLCGEENENEGIGTITFIKGTCQIREEDGEYKTAGLDQIVLSSDTVKTMEGSEAEITISDGNVVKITEDSEVTLNNWQIREESHTDIGILFGSIKLFIKRFSREKDDFSINTATITAGVRGTEFDVSLREDGEVLINVEEGSVETDFDGTAHTITKGNASVYSLEGLRKDYKGKIEYMQWRRQALERIKENPELFLKRMLTRERMIIARLIKSKERMDQYRNDFAVFLKKVQYLHGRKMYPQERALIIQQVEKTRRALGFFIAARRQLVGIRSLIVLAGRIEMQLEPEAALRLPSLLELRREYRRISFIITRINEADRKLRGVLFMLNRRLDELNRLIGE